jgi:hypothetical protein
MGLLEVFAPFTPCCIGLQSVLQDPSNAAWAYWSLLDHCHNAAKAIGRQCSIQAMLHGPSDALCTVASMLERRQVAYETLP